MATRLRSGTKHALNIGCGVGAASFGLARLFDRVTGIDESAKCIAAAQQLRNVSASTCSACSFTCMLTDQPKQSGECTYQLADDAGLQLEHVARVPHDVDATRIVFVQVGQDGKTSLKAHSHGCSPLFVYAQSNVCRLEAIEDASVDLVLIANTLSAVDDTR